MNKELIIKSVGLGATFIGMAATLVSDWVTKEQTDLKISKEVQEQVAKQIKIILEEKGL